MTDEPDDYEITLDCYEAALGNDLSALQGRVKELKAKLAWAVDALRVFADDANWCDKVFKNGVTMNPTWRGPTFTPEEFARDVITVLTGGKDE